MAESDPSETVPDPLPPEASDATMPMGSGELPKLGSAQVRRGGWQAPEPAELQPSFPQYEIQAVLGRGGMGAVYKGWQKSLDRYVAIKILPPGLEDHGANFAERFQREAKAMARFSHPGIVSVFDAGETPGGLLFFVMEYIEGTDVQKLVRENGPLSPEHALGIAAHVCDALAYAHKRGVIHRDIKPANIMVDAEGQVKVADFGLAKIANDDSAALVTGSHVSMGTLDFMAPEALYGMGHVDHRADLYAVGVMLYQMLTGEVPRGRFELPSIQRPGLDPRFDAIVDRAMQKDPERRYGSATEIRTDLDRILTTPVPHQSAVAAPPPPPSAPQPAVTLERPAAAPGKAEAARASAPRSRRWVWLSSGVAASILALIAGGSVIFRGSHSRDATERARADSAIPAPVSSQSPSIPAPPATPAKAPDETTAPRKLAVASRTLDLLALADPQRDRIESLRSRANRWEKAGGVLTYRSDGFSGKISSPVALNASDYEIEVAFRRTTVGERFHIDLPMPGQKVVPLIVGQNKTLINLGTGSANIGSSSDLATALSGQIIARVHVGSGASSSVRVFLDGKEIATWTGDFALLAKTGVTPHRDFPDELVTSLYCENDGYEFTTWQLRILAGEAKVLRPSSSPVAPSSSPGAATKDSPFVNSLGMKFVPVPITGGPTDGKRVLFSVWETRVQDYEAFAKDTGKAARKPSFEQGPTHPAVLVSWDDANAFCTWLTERERKAGRIDAAWSYRLPFDHEWSCATGYGNKEDPSRQPQSKNQTWPDLMFWGRGWPPPAGVANYAGQEVAGQPGAPTQFIEGWSDRFVFTAPVGSFPASPLGLFDLAGNVWEVVQEYYDAARPKERATRGGSYVNMKQNEARMACRSMIGLTSTSANVGFRIVLASE